MSTPRELAYRIDPVLWVRQVLGVQPMSWQEQFLRAPQGASIIALTARQVGKTTSAAWAIAHYMLFTPGGLRVVPKAFTNRGRAYANRSNRAAIPKKAVAAPRFSNAMQTIAMARRPVARAIMSALPVSQSQGRDRQRHDLS